MTRVEGAYALKLKGQLLAGSVRASPQEVFDDFSKFLSLGGKIIEVSIAEVDARPCFQPTVYLYLSPDSGLCMGAISFEGDVSEPKKIDSDHPIVGIVQKATGVKKLTYDSIFLVEVCEEDSRARMTINFSITDDGDTTTVSKVVQRGGIQKLIHGFLEKFNF